MGGGRAMKKIMKSALFSTVLLLCIALPQMTALGATIIISVSESVSSIQNRIQDEISKALPGETITVTGSKTNPDGTLELNISAGVRVIWQATYSGSFPSGWSNPLIVLTGDGTFEVTGSNALLRNQGTGSTIYGRDRNSNVSVVVSGGTVQALNGSAIELTGMGTVTVEGYGSVFNESNTNVQPAINMSNPNNTTHPNNVIVKDNGRVAAQSGAGNGYAIQSYGNVNISEYAEVFAIGTGGRAINALATGNVTVSGGTVWSQNGITICGRSYITISGGLVYNNSSNSSYPVIGTVSNESVNVTVNGEGKVEARGTGTTAYGISTPGNVTIGGNAKVSATAGRAINLTSTSTSTGNATVSGNSWVSATTGNAINATSGSVTVNGGWVSATTGYAIGGTASGGVEVNGGFVFAYGTGTGNVVQRSYSLNSGPLPANGIVVAWNRAQGGLIYPEGAFGNSDPLNGYLTVQPILAIPEDVHWTGGGISYKNGTNNGFFPVPEVTVYSTDGLAFNLYDGKFYLYSPLTERLGGVYDKQNGNYEFDPDPESKTPPLDEPYTLTLKGFTWNTFVEEVPIGLAIMYFNPGNFGADDEFNPFTIKSGSRELTIKLEGSNSFTANGQQKSKDSFGIYANEISLTIEGSGTLNAAGSETIFGEHGSIGIFINAGDIEIKSGTVTATGVSDTTGGAGIFVLEGDVKISGGTVTATGGGGSNFGFGIVANGIENGGIPDTYGKIVISGGTVTARGPEQAFWTGDYVTYTAPPIPIPNKFSVTDSAYIWWANTVNAHPGGDGTLSFNSKYNDGVGYNESHKYVRIAATPLAIVENVTIGGTTGTALTTLTATIKLYGPPAKAAPIDTRFPNIAAVSWFTDIPHGITVTATFEPGDIIKLTFNGVPTSDSYAPFNITIPGNVLDGNIPLAVQFNPNARFWITSPFDELDCRGGCDSGANFSFAALALLLSAAAIRTGGLRTRKAHSRKRIN